MKPEEERHPTAEDAMVLFDYTMDREEYRHLGLDRDAIRAAFQQRLDEVVRGASVAAYRKDRAEAASENANRPRKGLIGRLGRPRTLAWILATIAWLAVLPERPTPFWFTLGGGLAGISAVALVMNWWERRRERARLRAAADQARASYRAELERVVGEVVRLVINDVYKGTGVRPFATIAPALVELNAAAVVPSDPHRYVSEFVASHSTSAIGVAGPRGAGKSSLLRAICAGPPDQQVAVSISAPVHYETLDFTRRLVLTVTRTLLEVHGIDPDGYQAAAARRRRATRAALLPFFAAIALLIVFLVFPRPTFAAAAAVFFLSGMGLVLLQSYRSTPSLVGPKAPPHVRLAAELYEAIEWEREQTQTSKASFALAGAALGGERQAATTRRRRGRSHPDLVADFSDMLTRYSQEAGSRRLIIAVDELDKLSKSSDLIDAVNGMKDLFHIPGVHFVVTVSTDALARFEQRGLPARDAFDSAFDTIVRVGRLSAEESVKVVHERAIGFPRALAIFCHAWSGGLPRDLLRSARACFELQRRRTSLMTAAEMVRLVVTGDVDDVVRSRIETLGAGSDENVDEIAVRLLRVQELITRVRAESLREQVALEQLEAIEPTGVDDVLMLARIGLGTLFFFTQAVTFDSEEEEKEHGLLQVADVVASAVASLGLPAPVRDSWVTRALRETGLLPITNR